MTMTTSDSVWGAGDTGTKEAEVWSSLWQHRSSPQRDNEILARERTSPRWQEIVRRLQQAFGSIQGLRTVELGCGRGDLSVLLAERGAAVTLVDSCPEALAQASERFDRPHLDAELVNADMFQFAAERAKGFDLAVSSGVIEHFKGEDRTRAIQAHYDAVRSGGLVVISVPHARCLPYRIWKSYLELRGWWPYGYERPYTRRELVRRARRVGLIEPDAVCLNFLQSLGGHWVRRLSGRRPAWSDNRSPLDGLFGFTLLFFGKRVSLQLPALTSLRARVGS